MESDDQIALGGWEGPRVSLDAAAGAELGDTGAAAALRDVIANPDGIPTLPERGWRLLQADEDHAVFAVPEGPGSEAWDVVHIQRQETTWAYHSSSHGAVPEPTLAQRGAGLRLVWPEDEIVRQQGDFGDIRILLRNDRSEVWEDDRGEYQPIADVIDLTSGAAFDDGYVYVIGVGRSYRLDPGEAVSLHVICDIEVERTLPPGRYGIVAQLWELGLRSDQAVLRII